MNSLKREKGDTKEFRRLVLRSFGKGRREEEYAKIEAHQERILQVTRIHHQLINEEEKDEVFSTPEYPCMSTASCVVDMGKGKLELSVEDQKISFDLFAAMKHPDDREAYVEEEKVEQEIDSIASTMVLRSLLEKELDNNVECLVSEDEGEVLAFTEDLDGPQDKSVGPMIFEELKNSRPIEKPKVELKTLPAYLKYVYLEDNEAKSVIISSSLQKKEEDQLVQILKSYKAAIGWHISDLKGISPSYCMHKINMVADYKPVRQPQTMAHPDLLAAF